MNDQEKKSWINQHFATIVVALFSLVATTIGGFYAYNQSTREKLTDFKIEQMKEESYSKAAKNNRHIAIIFGEMWELMLKLNADRCFIIQPHPEHKHLFLSVALEVDKKGVSAVKDIFQNVPISDMAIFVKILATTVWLYYDDVDHQVFDKKAQSLMFLAGSTQIAIRQLVDVNGSWIGSLVVENINHKEYDKDFGMEAMKNSANTIQFILPPIN